MKKLFTGYLCSLFLAGLAYAGPGHDHGEERIATVPELPVAPRLVMESSQFELVGLLEGNGLHLYLDDYATNVPVEDASVELEIAGERITAEAEGQGNYHAALPISLGEGEHAVLVTILAGNATDLLIGELDIHHKEEMLSEGPDQKEINNRVFALWPTGFASLALVLLSITWLIDRQQRRGQS